MVCDSILDVYTRVLCSSNLNKLYLTRLYQTFVTILVPLDPFQTGIKTLIICIAFSIHLNLFFLNGVSRHHGGLIVGPAETPQTITKPSY